MLLALINRCVLARRYWRPCCTRGAGSKAAPRAARGVDGGKLRIRMKAGRA